MILETGPTLVRMESSVSSLTILPCAALTGYARVWIVLRRMTGGRTHHDRASIALPILGDGGSTMDDAPHQLQAEEQREEATLLKLREAFHQCMHECRACRREIAGHWQCCAHCGIRLATHCPGCGNPLPPLGAQACPRCGVAVPHVEP